MVSVPPHRWYDRALSLFCRLTGRVWFRYWTEDDNRVRVYVGRLDR